jgi:hypothetical protein
VDALLVKNFFGEAKPGSTEAPSMGPKIRFLYQLGVTDGPNAVGHASELEGTRIKTGVGKGEGGRQEDGKCLPQTEKQKDFFTKG